MVNEKLVQGAYTLLKRRYFAVSKIQVFRYLLFVNITFHVSGHQNIVERLNLLMIKNINEFTAGQRGSILINVMKYIIKFQDLLFSKHLLQEFLLQTSQLGRIVHR